MPNSSFFSIDTSSSQHSHSQLENLSDGNLKKILIDWALPDLLLAEKMSPSLQNKVVAILLSPDFWFSRFKPLTYQEILKDMACLESCTNQILGVGIDQLGGHEDKEPNAWRDKLGKTIIETFDHSFWEEKLKELSDSGERLEQEENDGLAYLKRGIALLRMDEKNNHSLANIFTSYPTKELTGDKKFAIQAMTQNGDGYRYLSQEAQSDQVIALTAVSHYGESYRKLPENLKEKYDLAKAAVTNNGLTLQCLNESFKAVPDIVKSAVEQNGWALQYASDDLRVNKDIVLTAVENCGNAITYAYCSLASGELKDLRDDKEVALKAVQQNGLALAHVSDRLKQDEDVVRAAVKQDKMALQYAEGSIKKNPAFLKSENFSYLLLFKILGWLEASQISLAMLFLGRSGEAEPSALLGDEPSSQASVNGYFSRSSGELAKAVNTHEENDEAEESAGCRVEMN